MKFKGKCVAYNDNDNVNGVSSFWVPGRGETFGKDGGGRERKSVTREKWEEV